MTEEALSATLEKNLDFAFSRQEDKDVARSFLRQVWKVVGKAEEEEEEQDRDCKRSVKLAFAQLGMTCVERLVSSAVEIVFKLASGNAIILVGDTMTGKSATLAVGREPIPIYIFTHRYMYALSTF